MSSVMPPAPKRPCRTRTCPHFQPCPVHGIRGQDPRQSSWVRGYDRRHRHWRTMVLNQDQHLCRLCRQTGLLTLATVADHITPLAQGGDWSLENGQALCASCHGAKSRGEHRG
jgi:5-methylcytosine-specific restriction protein A